jgi:predicted transcriptional regulator
MDDPVPTPRELQALKALWTLGPATVREVHESLAAEDGMPDLAYTTVLSLLQTMEQKGLVNHQAGEKAYRYHATAKRETVFRRLAAGFLEQVFDGALSEYVARALESRPPSLAELEDLEKRIDIAKRALIAKRKPKDQP